MTDVSETPGVSPPRFLSINMLSGSGQQRHGEVDGGVDGGAQDGEEGSDHGMLMEELVGDVEDEDEVARLFGNFYEEGDDQQPGPQQERHEDQEEENPVRRPANLPLPVAPSQDEWDDHFRSHIEYQPWCPICVQARGREDGHQREAEGPQGVPKVCLDY